ncbi:MAG: 2'-5' RNA ligase family protein [Saprospirales bacterium]|nr:2'-5' RNA ligase family protein [Saprospirales bacterium]
MYFIALIPPDPIALEVKAFKELAAARFHTKRALNSPAHITLQPPFSMPEDRLGELTALLHDFVQTATPFSQELRDFGCFKPRVIFVDIVLNDALLDLAARLKSRLTPLLGEAAIDTRPYHPHMTVAFKDLTPQWFYRAWEHFSTQSYHRTFDADALFLLQHNGREWKVMNRFGFEQN